MDMKQKQIATDPAPAKPLIDDEASRKMRMMIAKKKLTDQMYNRPMEESD